MSSPKFLKQPFKKRGCRERSVPAGGRGGTFGERPGAEKLVFPFLLAAAGRERRKETWRGSPPTPARGLPLETPPEKRIEWKSNVRSKNSG